jgi:nucleoside 2-deoxyribosyltransferase
MTVAYLSGPMANCTDGELYGWRTYMKTMLQDTDIKWMDPADRDYRQADYSKIGAKIVIQDKDDILDSDVVVANCWKPGWGTAMEIMYCYETAIPVISIVPGPPEEVSPWIRHHSVYVVRTVEEAAELLRDWYPRRNGKREIREI